MQVEICKCCGKPKKKTVGTREDKGRVTTFGGGETNPSLITSPATPAAAEWDGWGTALKPAWEPIIVARKPIVGTVAENVQRYGTGAMNIAACRIGVDEHSYKYSSTADGGVPHKGVNGAIDGRDPEKIAARISANRDMQSVTVSGRWPANLIHDGSAEVLAGFPSPHGAGSERQKYIGNAGSQNINIGGGITANRFGDTGSAARFFYCAKASKADRDEGLEGLEEKRVSYMNTANGNPDKGEEWQPIDDRTGEARNRFAATMRNHHPTVKPTALMRYLCRLVTPPNGTILDPFMGSGSTGKAAMLEGFNFIGIDTEIEYVEIAARRIEHACEKVGIVVDQPMMFDTKRETVDKPKQLILL